MRIKILLIFALMTSLIACKNQPSTEYYGKWEMLTIEGSDTIIFDPCEYANSAIIFAKESITCVSEQDESNCKIMSLFTKNNKTFIILEHGCLAEDTISFEVVEKNLLKWTLWHEMSFISTNCPQNYKIVEENCKEYYDEPDEAAWIGHYQVDAEWENQSLTITITDFDHVTIVFKRNDKEEIHKTKISEITPTKIELEYNDEQTLYIDKLNNKYYLSGNIFAFDPSCRELPLIKSNQQ